MLTATCKLTFISQMSALSVSVPRLFSHFLLNPFRRDGLFLWHSCWKYLWCAVLAPQGAAWQLCFRDLVAVSSREMTPSLHERQFVGGGSSALDAWNGANSCKHLYPAMPQPLILMAYFTIYTPAGLNCFRFKMHVKLRNEPIILWHSHTNKMAPSWEYLSNCHPLMA